MFVRFHHPGRLAGLLLAALPALGTTPGTAGAGAAAAPAGGTVRRVPAASLEGLPTALKEFLAREHGANALRGLNLEFREAARSATRSLTVDQDTRDEDLLALMRNHPAVRSLRIADGSRLSAAGLVAALNLNLKLEALDIQDNCHFDLLDVLRGLGATHLDLRRLSLGEVPLTDEVLERFAGRLTQLHLGCGTSITDAAVAKCVRLESFRIDRATNFRGDALPRFLKSCEIIASDQFDGIGLPPELVSLTVQRCPRFEGVLALPGLASLRIFDCPRVTSDRLMGIGRFHPGLRSLATNQGVSELALAPFAPGLRRLEVCADAHFGGSCLGAFEHLEQLDIRNSPAFTGSNLPRSLSGLKVTNCAAFNPPALVQPALAQLEVDNCPRFGLGEPASPLLSLRIIRCRRVTPAHLKGAVAALPTLRSLEFQLWGRGALDTAEFAGHPGLCTVKLRKWWAEPVYGWERPGRP